MHWCYHHKERHVCPRKQRKGDDGVYGQPNDDIDNDGINNNEDKQKLVIKYKNKQFLFKENIYLFNSYAENEIFAQRRSILLNSFLEFNEKSNMLTEVNSWLYKVNKDDYICKKSDSSKGYK